MANGVINFLNQYVHHLKEIGSIAPDSSSCIKSIINQIPFDNVELILEFGAGSGAVTREIIKRKKSISTLISFEKNNAFYNHLRRNVTGRNFFILHENVFNSRNTLLQCFGFHIGSVDCIVSTLPWSSMKFEKLIENEVLPLLNVGGVFIQYMHTISVFKGIMLQPLLKKYFDQIDSRFVFFNMPPALVYICRNHLDHKLTQSKNFTNKSTLKKVDQVQVCTE